MSIKQTFQKGKTIDIYNIHSHSSIMRIKQFSLTKNQKTVMFCSRNDRLRKVSILCGSGFVAN